MKYTPTHFWLPIVFLAFAVCFSATGQDERKQNRLAKETSPYLLQHAANPVDWYAWGDEAFAKAKRENKPIFLSVGYSSCHWCHVMERESFTDKEIADFLNTHFVCIKVDREERPDVDSIYMTAVHIYNQITKSGRGGGWPLSAFLTPEAEPFFAATYFPARDGDRGAGTGFLTIIQRIQDVWQKDSTRIREDGKMLARYVKLEIERRRADLSGPLDAKVLAEASSLMAERFDSKYGGFTYDPANPQRPKFPEPSNLILLLERARRGDTQSLQMLETTLEKMSLGGIRDHLGGGFHRYSVDRYWQIPHFEKMLYDNGQLASVYAEAFELTKREDFRRVVTEILEFIEREMLGPDGGFYSAIDADSEHEEGKFYRWHLDEIRKIVDTKSATNFYKFYGLNEPPNFERHFHVLQLSQPLSESAKTVGIPQTELDKSLSVQRKQLLDVRSQRVRPITDDKILTSWNGLMIRGFADAGRLLENAKYVTTATKAADFVLKNSRDNDGKLKRTHSKGHSRLNAYLDDYAFFINGLLALHRATKEDRWLTAAESLQQKQNELFWDETQGGYFFTSEDHETLLARSKDPVDGAEPSGNSVSAENLWYLALQTKRSEYRAQAEKTIQGAASVLQQSPLAAPRMLAVFTQVNATKSK